MKILQLNTWACRLDSEIVKLLAKEDPDIVCFQEVVSSSSSTGKITGRIEEITANHPFNGIAYSPLIQINYMHGTLQRGNCILSKYPIVATETFFTHGEYQPNFDYDKQGYNSARGVQQVVIDTPTGTINVLNTHGYHVSEHKNGNPETLSACQQIAERVSRLDGKVIVAGDFNLAPHSESISVLNAILNNLCLDNDVQTTRNHLTDKTEVCDYIFVNDKIEIKDFRVLDEVVSDHKALVASFN